MAKVKRSFVCLFFPKIQSTNFQADSGSPSRPTRSKFPVPRQHTGVGKKGRKDGKKVTSNDGTEDEREFRVVKLPYVIFLRTI